MRKSANTLHCRVQTQTFYEYIFPPRKLLEEIPNVTYKDQIVSSDVNVLLIYSQMGWGKTETVRRIAEEAVKLYGEENVNASYVEGGNLEKLITYGLEDKLVNILFCDDLTLVPIDQRVLAAFFRLRHRLASHFNRRNGYILGILAIHRWHNIPVVLRSASLGVIVKSTSLEEYDNRVIKKLVGQENYEWLRAVEKQGMLEKQYRRYGVFSSKHLVCRVEFPLATKNYLRKALSEYERIYGEVTY